MRGTERNRLQVLRRVRDFLKPWAEEPTLKAALLELDGVIERMTGEAERQGISAQQAKIGTHEVAALAHALRLDVMRPVLRLVRRVAPDAFSPSVPGGVSLTLPRSADRQALITAANALYQTAKQYETRLTAAGLPKDHLAKLVSASDALRDAIDTRAQQVLQRGAAGTTAAAEGRRSMAIVQLLDALVVPLLRGDAGRLKAWSAAKRLRGRTVVAPESIADGGDGSVAPAGTGVTMPAVALLSRTQTAAEGGAEEVDKAA